MAATKSAKNPTSHNDTPNTPKVREGAIAKMKVAELRQKLRGHGVKGTADLKKPELVQKLIKAEVATGNPRRSAKNPTPRNDTPNTPDVSESAIAAMKADDLRRRLRGHGVKGTADLKKPELVQQLVKLEVTSAKKTKAAGAKKTTAAGAGKTTAASSKKTTAASSKKTTAASAKAGTKKSAKQAGAAGGKKAGVAGAKKSATKKSAKTGAGKPNG